MHVISFLSKAVPTQGGSKTTTIKNALSDLYNITAGENNQISCTKNSSL